MTARRNKTATSTREPLPVLLSDHEWKHIQASLQLSRRQADIVYQLMRGMDDKQIAAELAMSPFTVRSHLHSIFLKLNAADRVGVILRVFAAMRSAAAPSLKSTS